MTLFSACSFWSVDEKGLQLTMDSSTYDVNQLAWLEIRNFTDSPVYVKGCTVVYPLYAVQKRNEDGSFTDVYRQACLQGGASARKVDVESASRIQMRVRMDLGRGDVPTGTYRVFVQMHRLADTSDTPIDTTITVSHSFFVR